MKRAKIMPGNRSEMHSVPQHLTAQVTLATKFKGLLSHFIKETLRYLPGELYLPHSGSDYIKHHTVLH